MSRMLSKLINFLKQNYLIVGIIFLGFFLRVFQLKDRFSYAHDQDLIGWFVKDVVVNKHLRLIGQETSTQGVFIGPLFYYLIIPFYLLTKMDPIGGGYLVTGLGIFGIASFYFVFSKVFDKLTGLIASLIYSCSFYTVTNDRYVVPTMPVILWSVWSFYGLNILLKGRQKTAYLLLGFLIGLIWNLNVSLVLILPLIGVSQYFSKRKIELVNVFLGVLTLLTVSIPFIVFETRHGFSQIHSVYTLLTTPQYDIVGGYEKLLRVIHLLGKDVHGLIVGSMPWFSYNMILYLILGAFIFLVTQKRLNKKVATLMALWIFFYVAFFSSYSKIVSEYYLNGTVVIFIAILSLTLSFLFERKDLKHFGVILLSLFVVFNLNKFFMSPVNKSGYLERRAVVSEIKRDASEKGYPCVAVSYITDPGYELGYRYFFWLEDLHVNRPNSGSPVYTIVFPLKPIFSVDNTFGAIGLIYPDYSRDTKEGIEKSCSGENSNLTDPMFGFTN